MKRRSILKLMMICLTRNLIKIMRKNSLGSKLMKKLYLRRASVLDSTVKSSSKMQEIDLKPKLAVRAWIQTNPYSHRITLILMMTTWEKLRINLRRSAKTEMNNWNLYFKEVTVRSNLITAVCWRHRCIALKKTMYWRASMEAVKVVTSNRKRSWWQKDRQKRDKLRKLRNHN